MGMTRIIFALSFLDIATACIPGFSWHWIPPPPVVLDPWCYPPSYTKDKRITLRWTPHSSSGSFDVEVSRPLKCGGLAVAGKVAGTALSLVGFDTKPESGKSKNTDYTEELKCSGDYTFTVTELGLLGARGEPTELTIRVLDRGGRCDGGGIVGGLAGGLNSVIGGVNEAKKNLTLGNAKDAISNALGSLLTGG